MKTVLKFSSVFVAIFALWYYTAPKNYNGPLPEVAVHEEELLERGRYKGNVSISIESCSCRF